MRGKNGAQLLFMEVETSRILLNRKIKSLSRRHNDQVHEISSTCRNARDPLHLTAVRPQPIATLFGLFGLRSPFYLRFRQFSRMVTLVASLRLSKRRMSCVTGAYSSLKSASRHDTRAARMKTSASLLESTIFVDQYRFKDLEDIFPSFRPYSELLSPRPMANPYQL